MTIVGKNHIWRWLALVIGGLFITAFAAGFAWWQQYKTTPAYSLALRVDAAQRNDASPVSCLLNKEKV